MDLFNCCQADDGSETDTAPERDTHCETLSSPAAARPRADVPVDTGAPPPPAWQASAAAVLEPTAGGRQTEQQALASEAAARSALLRRCGGRDSNTPCQLAYGFFRSKLTGLFGSWRRRASSRQNFRVELPPPPRVTAQSADDPLHIAAAAGIPLPPP
eukprot:SAG11_NODE_6476_length_1305_cov_7.106136_1_plen_157_part_01